MDFVQFIHPAGGTNAVERHSKNKVDMRQEQPS